MFTLEITKCILYFDINKTLYFINNIKFDLTVITLYVIYNYIYYNTKNARALEHPYAI